MLAISKIKIQQPLAETINYNHNRSDPVPITAIKLFVIKFLSQYYKCSLNRTNELFVLQLHLHNQVKYFVRAKDDRLTYIM